MIGIKSKTKVMSMASKEGKSKKKKTAPAVLRIQKDLADLTDKQWDVEFPDPDNLQNFKLYITPEEGLWKGHKTEWEVTIPNDYPIKPPKCLCKTKVWHPNIDQDGKPCLNILREEWKPVLTLNAVFVGINFLFLEPNTSDPLNTEAAREYDENYPKFKRKAQAYMRGEY
eukprot:gb/GECH01011825.1/.p1 GENE.gb/GECH01011825.1/~~gb/GECH01011825.1/.p1  ORF type:complete len:170 (+),score=36.74 gb/GECH01011825.1/:1-510(+)